jgi:hypothetical protein
MGLKSDADISLLGPMLLQTWIFGIRERRRLSRGQSTPLARQSAMVLAVVLGLLQLITFLNAFTQAVPETAIALLWSAGLATWLLVIGLQSSRVLTAGGFVIILSIIAALVRTESLFGWLAVGMVAGLCVPGAVLGFGQPLSQDLGEDDRFVTLHSGGRLTTD